MRSTEIIHEIIEDYGLDDKQNLMILLKDLRQQVAQETRNRIMKSFTINRTSITAEFNSLLKHYRNGT